MRNLLFLLVLSLMLPCAMQGQLSEKQRYDIAKNLEIYNAVVKELNLFYVDSIDMNTKTKATMGYLLRSLDPYNEYVPEENMTEFLQQTTGEYGGVGSIITSRRGQDGVFFTEPYEGMPAQQAGIQAGDELLEIDGVSMKGKDSSFASERLRGVPNTTLKIKYQRPGETKPRETELTRRRIEINPVEYYGVLKEGVGYIYLSGFTTHSAQGIYNALTDLVENKKITSLVIDVRDNGGGVVEDCVEILNNFIRKDELLLTMKGRIAQSNRTYKSNQTAYAPELPVAVLVNRNSASASEILAGAMQDLDRGVVIGTRTHGKGWVQSTRQLPYNGSLKLTTARYYTPSGRCIQAVDYTHRNADGTVSYTPDSLTNTFYTRNGRPVKDGGGIQPDVEVKGMEAPNIAVYMELDNLFFDFVVQWRQKNPRIETPDKFALSDEIYEAFKEFVRSKEFTYDRQSEKSLNTLKEIMDFEGYSELAAAEFEALENKLKPDLDRDLERYKEELRQILSMEIMKQYYYARGQVQYLTRGDNVLDKAIEILSDPGEYQKLLTK